MGGLDEPQRSYSVVTAEVYSFHYLTIKKYKGSRGGTTNPVVLYYPFFCEGKVRYLRTILSDTVPTGDLRRNFVDNFQG